MTSKLYAPLQSDLDSMATAPMQEQPDSIISPQQRFQNNQFALNSVAAAPADAAAPIVFAQYNPPVGPNSTELKCPHCKCMVKTRVRHRSTAKTHIACLLLSWTCCLCCVPYCMNTCRNANHFCPMCETFLGTYQS